MRGNDGLVTGPAVSWLVLRGALLVVIVGGAAALIPIPLWFFAAVACAVVAAVLPASYAGWAAIACIVVGMLFGEPDLGRAMLGVLVVHLVHVLSALGLLVPPGARIVLAALRPSLVRVALIQAIAQPLTMAVMAVLVLDGATAPWVAAAGGAAMIAVVVLLIAGVRRAQIRPDAR